jgi:hypothetical protein
MAAVPGIGGLLDAVTPLVLNGLAGIAAGALVLAGVSLGSRLFKRPAA